MCTKFVTLATTLLLAVDFDINFYLLTYLNHVHRADSHILSRPSYTSTFTLIYLQNVFHNDYIQHHQDKCTDIYYHLC